MGDARWHLLSWKISQMFCHYSSSVQQGKHRVVFFDLDGDDFPLWIVYPGLLITVLGETPVLLVGAYDLVQNEKESFLISEMTLKTTQTLGKKKRDTVTEGQDILTTKPEFS